MYLSGLRGLVPELSHPSQVQSMSSGHFSLLQVKEREDKMHFLNEVFEHVSNKPVLHKKFDFNKRVSHWYPTMEPAVRRNAQRTWTEPVKHVIVQEPNP